MSRDAGGCRQLGTGTRSGGFEAQPRAVAGMEGVEVVAVGAGRRHSAAGGREGQLWTWGSNLLGQCGMGDEREVGW